MIALYVLSGLCAYLGVGYKCANAGLDYSTFHGTSKKTAVSHAQKALFLWPWWLCTKGTNILFWKIVTDKKNKQLIQQKQDAEIQKLLDSGEI